MNRVFRSILVCVLTAAMIFGSGADSLKVKASGSSDRYFASVQYTYYASSSEYIDIHFHKKPTVPMIFECGSWTYTKEPTEEKAKLPPDYSEYQTIYTFGGSIFLDETDFEKGTPLKLVSYPVPEGFEATNAPVIVRTKDDSDYKSASFIINLKKAGELTDLKKLGCFIKVETYPGGDPSGICQEGGNTWPYTGKEVCPKVLSVTTINKDTLEEGVDYTVSYVDNIEPGHPGISINGIENYTGTATFYYRYQIYDTNYRANEKDTETPDQDPTDTSSPDSDSDDVPIDYEDIENNGKLQIKNIEYALSSLSGSTGELTVKGISDKDAVSVEIPDKIQAGDYTLKVTSIAKGAFAGTDIKSVRIGKYVKKIGEKAFYKCSRLESVTIGSKVTKIDRKAFYKCSRLKSVKMGSKVSSVGEKAFYQCKKLKSITLGSKVSSIGKEAFSKCAKLAKIKVKSRKLTLQKTGKNAFKGVYKKAKIDVPSSKKKAYKKLFTSRGAGKSIKVY